MSAPGNPWRTMAHLGLRAWLLLLAAMVTLPLLGVTIASLLRDHDIARQRSEEQLVMQARALAFTVQSQLATAAAVARTLAHSVALARGDLAGFRVEMTAATVGLAGAQVALADRQSRLMATTLLPPSDVVPPDTLSIASAFARAAGQDSISDLFVSPVGKHVQLSATALVPALADAAATYPGAVNVLLRPAFFAPMLHAQTQAHAPGWVAMLADRQLRIVSRSDDTERVAYVQRIPPEMVAAVQRGASGVTRVLRPSGVVAVDAFARVAGSDYVVVIGQPEAEFAQGQRGSLWAVLAVAGPLVLAGFGLAIWLSNRITRAVGALAVPAGNGTEGLRFREVDLIAERLASAERWRLMLLHEMKHRLKNTLMSVQSLAVQTQKAHPNDPAQFQHAFSGRLATLARAHDLLTETSCETLDSDAVMAAALAPWLDAPGHAVSFRIGRSFMMGPRQAQALMLALHELATNAAKYGALSCPGGTVHIDCTLDEDSGFARIGWMETGGPVVVETARRGFGSRLLEVLLPQDLGPGATVLRELNPAGLRASIGFRPQASAAPVGD